MIAIAVRNEPLLSMSTWRHGTTHTYRPPSTEKTKTTHLFSFVLACCASEAKELSLVTDPEPRGIHKGTSWDVFSNPSGAKNIKLLLEVSVVKSSQYTVYTRPRYLDKT